jgi:hypothetical protein
MSVGSLAKYFGKWLVQQLMPTEVLDSKIGVKKGRGGWYRHCFVGRE